MKIVALLAALAVIATVGPVAAAPPMGSAEAHCVVTGATGYGRARLVEDAIEKAVAACIAKGGIPTCCRKGARPI